jgi:hypothetical protein
MIDRFLLDKLFIIDIDGVAFLKLDKFILQVIKLHRAEAKYIISHGVV